MIKLNKKTEYALLALRYMSQAGDADVASVKEMASHYGIPEMILAKVLQTLKRGGIASSVKGAGGGYRLLRPLAKVGVIEVLELFGETMTLVECIDAECQQQIQCDIQSPMGRLNDAISAFLTGMSVEQLFAPTAPQAPSKRPAQLSIYR